MPYTTLAWMGGMLSGGVQGGWALLVILAIVVDLLHLAGGGRHYHRHFYHRGHVHHVEPDGGARGAPTRKEAASCRRAAEDAERR